MVLSENKSVLLIDDEKDILDFLSYNLKKEGYKVYTAENGEEGLKIAKEIHPDLILLDLMMPVMDGIETCQNLREVPELNDTIIVFLTSRSEDYSQVAGYEAGGDDYVNKPIRPRLLISKLNAHLRRNQRSIQESEPQEAVGLFLNRNRYVVELDGTDIYLPKKEFELLELLISKPGKVFTRDQIMSQVWGNDTVVGTRTIDVHIRKLREKLGDTYIRTLKGIGYTFNGQ
jgi:two-component system alkaline phosphatase synthesis response regulator PhoP